MREDDSVNVHGNDDCERDVPVEATRQECVVGLVGVVERVRRMYRPAVETGWVADEWEQQLAAYEDVLQVVCEQIAEGDRNKARQQARQRR